MKIIVIASDGADIPTTKAHRNSDLLSYIIENIPEDREAIQIANKKIRELKNEIREIKSDLWKKTGYSIPGF